MNEIWSSHSRHDEASTPVGYIAVRITCYKYTYPSEDHV